MENSGKDYKEIFTQLIHKQMAILGPQITLLKVKNVQGITIDSNGTVTDIQGDPEKLMQALIAQFVELSGLIVKQTMESIMSAPPKTEEAAAKLQEVAKPTVVQHKTEEKAEEPAVVQVDSAENGGSAADNLAVANPDQVQKKAVENTSPVEPLTASQPRLSEDEPSGSAVDPLVPQPIPTGPEDGPSPISSLDLTDFNKALDELSKSPLSNENSQTAQPHETQ